MPIKLKLRVHPKSGVPLNLPTNCLRARVNANLTPGEAAKLVYLGQATRWTEYERGKRSPDQARWMLFLLQTDQHPHFRLMPCTVVKLANKLADTLR